MGRRDLLSAEERRHLFGVPVDRDALARLYTFGPRDLSLIEARREERNRLGFAVQLALLRHPGMTLAQIVSQPGLDLDPLVGFIARQLDLPLAALTDYAAREQTMTDHAREIGSALGLRPPARTDLSLMIDAAASAAWSTDKGVVIAGAVIAALREKAIMLPAPATIERAGITGRAATATGPVRSVSTVVRTVSHGMVPVVVVLAKLGEAATTAVKNDAAVARRDRQPERQFGLWVMGGNFLARVAGV